MTSLTHLTDQAVAWLRDYHRLQHMQSLWDARLEAFYHRACQHPIPPPAPPTPAALRAADAHNSGLWGMLSEAERDQAMIAYLGGVRL